MFLKIVLIFQIENKYLQIIHFLFFIFYFDLRINSFAETDIYIHISFAFLMIFIYIFFLNIAHKEDMKKSTSNIIKIDSDKKIDKIITE